MFVLDAYGGNESTEIMEESRKTDFGFTYIWDQDEYWPGTGEYVCHIHFEFKDGTKMKKAFTYEWRLWTIPELKDLQTNFAEFVSHMGPTEMTQLKDMMKDLPAPTPAPKAEGVKAPEAKPEEEEEEAPKLVNFEEVATS